jgi:hypothetical protein
MNFSHTGYTAENCQKCIVEVYGYISIFCEIQEILANLSDASGKRAEPFAKRTRGHHHQQTVWPPYTLSERIWLLHYYFPKLCQAFDHEGVIITPGKEEDSPLAPDK